MDRQRFEMLCNYLEQSLEPSQAQDLEAAMQGDPELSDQLLLLAFEESVLKDWAATLRKSMELDEAIAREEVAPVPVPVPNHQRHNRWKRVLLTCGLVIVIASGWLWRPTVAETPAAVLKDVSGFVELVHVDGTTEGAAEGRSIGIGQEIQLKDERGSASVAYPDGSRLMLIGRSRLQLDGARGKQLRLLQGQIGANVSQQPVGERMVFVTPTATLEVIGTQFSLDASHEATAVSVVEGRVRLTRTHDGRSIEVTAGTRAVAGTGYGELTARASTPTAEMYDVDFEAGLPAGWKAGVAVRDGEPLRGAVRAEGFRERDGTVYGITSAKAWQEGLFPLRGGEHLHVTYLLSKPDWFQILISTRATSQGKPPLATYRFKDERMWWPLNPGNWRTATIPLASFGRVSDWSETPLSPGELPFELLFTAKDNNLSLVIDRIWVTRNGPGAFGLQDEN